MENINIGVLDYCILAVYVCMMLGVGFYFKASAKMAYYAVADKKLGLSVLIGTFLATGIGGGVLLLHRCLEKYTVKIVRLLEGFSASFSKWEAVLLRNMLH